MLRFLFWREFAGQVLLLVKKKRHEYLWSNQVALRAAACWEPPTDSVVPTSTPPWLQSPLESMRRGCQIFTLISHNLPALRVGAVCLHSQGRAHGRAGLFFEGAVFGESRAGVVCLGPRDG